MKTTTQSRIDKIDEIKEGNTIFVYWNQNLWDRNHTENVVNQKMRVDQIKQEGDKVRIDWNFDTSDIFGNAKISHVYNVFPVNAILITKNKIVGEFKAVDEVFQATDMNDVLFKL